ncbi:ROK family protein [Algoriphagus sp.]|uniref:ROK family protein n=1 Tax=Algoriphagus sp. TaxID=1872435 RepID=UPI00262EF73B|nr:ROK family protein [Algoriphagus sp.]
MEIIGVDIGGSHIAAGLVNNVGDRVEAGDFYEQAVDTFATAESIIEAWAQAIQSVKGYAKAIPIAIAMPGPFNYQEGICLIQDQGKMNALFGQSVKKLLADRLSVPPGHISFTNDAEAFLIAESRVGAGSAFSNSIGLTLGTGLGSAIQVEEVVKDAQLWRAPFKDGIAEDYLGTAWFIQFVQQKWGISLSGVKDLLDPSIDPAHRAFIFSEFGRNLGEFLFPYLIRLQTQGVILGGKISLASAHFLPATLEFLALRGISIPIHLATLGDHSALIGAALSQEEKKSPSRFS